VDISLDIWLVFIAILILEGVDGTYPSAVQATVYYHITGLTSTLEPIKIIAHHIVIHISILVLEYFFQIFKGPQLQTIPYYIGNNRQFPHLELVDHPGIIGLGIEHVFHHYALELLGQPLGD